MRKNFKVIYFIFTCLVTSLLFGCKKSQTDVTAARLLLSNPPDKISYEEGERFNPKGLEIIVQMSDGSMKAVEDFEYAPTSNLSIGTNKVTVTAEGLSLDVGISVLKDDPSIDEPKKIEKHLITNRDGSYGGTANLSRYGQGAPRNGEFDHLDSEYYSIIDYYNMQSTTSRFYYSKYKPYQQTMANTDGIANVLALLNYMGKDMSDINEQSLLAKYEQLNETTVFGNGTNAEGLQKLLNAYGVNSEANVYTEDTSLAINVEIRHLSEYLENEVFKKGYIMMVRLTDVNGFAWHTIVGLDNMGTLNWGRDDQAILMDSYDVLDHFQDGYYAVSLGRLYRWWEEIKVGRGTGHVNQFECVLVKPNTPFKMEMGPNQTMPTQVIPKKHLILNADGSYGGTRNKELYGTGATKNGSFDNVLVDYYKLVDYYNMPCTDTRKIMKNFMPFQQTMSSSCTLCSLMVTMNYYGEDIVNTYDEVAIVNCYERLNNVCITGVGCGCNGRMKVLAEYGFDARRNTVADVYTQSFFANYEEFKNWCWDLLSQDMPIPISWTPIGDHGEVIIGLETMGTDNIYDDVIVLADSSDNWDLYQDGFNTVPATLFFAQWFEGLDNKLSSQSFNYFYRKVK